mmetsp:Transcript_24211/g.52216  ORF Transcript_24211/g.52216 Transcript_24211/m.52216 type:complete len:184 (-) Transcript_24211:338-889(-)
MNIDVEQSAPLRRRLATPKNDDTGNRPRIPAPPPGLPPRHPLQILKRSAIIGGTLYAMHDFNVFHNILYSPKVSHEWFKVGLAASIAVMALKGYVELYEGKKKNKKVEYDNFKSATHWTILLIMISWISFHLALSPLYGTFKTWIIMIGFGFGVLIQSALMIPVWGQNILSVVLMTFFLQMYK